MVIDFGQLKRHLKYNGRSDIEEISDKLKMKVKSSELVKN